MMRVSSLAARILSVAACFSLVSSPVMAAALPQTAIRTALSAPAKAWSPEHETAHDRGRGGWGRRHHDDGIDGGDIFAGLLILGGIAAIASAAGSKDKEKRRDNYEYRERPVGDYANGGWQQPQSRNASRAMDEAVDTCASAAEASGDVSEIYGVQRDGAGYRISGKMNGGAEFSCSTGADGRVRELTVDGRDSAAYEAAETTEFEDSTGG